MNNLKKIAYTLSLCFFISGILYANGDVESTLNETPSTSVNEISNLKKLTILESAMPHELNPQMTPYSSDSQILSGLFEGLFSYNPITLEPQYAIATEYKISRDKKRWTFKLRPEALFSNGERITAQSVKEAWLNLLATPNAPYSSLFDIIRGAKEFRTGQGKSSEVGIYALDDYTLSVYLVKPANYLPKVMCHSAFSIIHRNPTVYSGPFILEDYDNAGYYLKKNDYYWDRENVQLDQIYFLQSNDQDLNTYLYNTGMVDWVTANIDTTKILNTNAIQLGAEFGTSYYFFKNSCKKPSKIPSVWDYPEFRNVVLEAFPWDIVRQGSIVPATTFVYPLPGYPQVEGFSYTDKIEALNKIKDARKKYNISEDEILTLTFAVSPYTLSAEKLQSIKDALSPLGIELKTMEYEPTTYLANVQTSEADLFAYTWIGDFADPLAFLELFRSDSTLNDSGWSDEQFDSLLDKAASANEQERMQILAQAETLLLDSGMILPSYHPVILNVIDTTEVGGWASNAFDIHPLKYLFKKEGTIKLPNVVLAK